MGGWDGCLYPHPALAAPPSTKSLPTAATGRSVLMGANIAEDIARGELSEATVGYSVRENACVLRVRGRHWWW